MKSIKACTHYPKGNVKPSGSKCEECGETFNLRVCMDCGHVGCCEDHPGQHALKHNQKTDHQIIKSYPPNQNGAFTWCYACNDYLENE